MPEMDGIEGHPPAACAGAGSAGDRPDRGRASRRTCALPLAVGMVAHVTKPIDIGILVGTILERG